MKRIWLRNIRKYALVDDRDYSKTLGYSWYGQNYRGCFYARTSIKKKIVPLHKFLMGSRGASEVDHKNGNTLDNRRSQNLRWATRSQNQGNAKTRKDNLLGVKGIQLKPGGKYQARMQHNNKSYFIGLFDTLSDAKIAHRKKAKELFGKFARL